MENPDENGEEATAPQKASRPRRRVAERSARRRAPVTVDPSYYLGYADDDETPEMIMRKFEALEKIQAEKATRDPDVHNGEEIADEASSRSSEPRGTELTAAEQAELFRQTSYFTVDMLARAGGMEGGGEAGSLSAVGAAAHGLAEADWLTAAALDDDEFERVWREMGIDTLLLDGEASDDEWEAYEDDDDELWDERGDGRQRAVGRAVAAGKVGAPSTLALELARARAALLLRLRAGGDASAAAQAAAMIPAAIRARRRRLMEQAVQRDQVPLENPLPRSWAIMIKPWDKVLQERHALRENVAAGRVHYVPRILDESLNWPRLLKRTFRCVVIDAPFERDRNFQVQHLRPLRLPELVPHGFVFVWVPKARISETVRWFADDSKQGGGGGGFHFVESFCVVRKWANNRLAVLRPGADAGEADGGASASGISSSSHSTCLLLRRPGAHIELAHQRNPDLCYDFVRPRGLPSGGGVGERPEFLYTVAEVLLPEVASAGDMLSVWADDTACVRKAWVSIVERPATTTKTTTTAT
eukprot:ctg_740.g174